MSKKKPVEDTVAKKSEDIQDPLQYAVRAIKRAMKAEGDEADQLDLLDELEDEISHLRSVLIKRIDNVDLQEDIENDDVGDDED